MLVVDWLDLAPAFAGNVKSTRTAVVVQVRTKDDYVDSDGGLWHSVHMVTNASTRNAQIVALAREGIPYDKIGALYGITRQRVYYLARKAGVSRYPLKGVAHILPDDVRKNRQLRRSIAYVESRPFLPGFPGNLAAKEAMLAWLRSQIVDEVPA